MNIEIDYLWSHKCPKKWDQYTLIALVITIIVLLILAGVTVTTLTGNNGMLNRTEIAKQRQDFATAKELLELKLTNIYAECIEKNEEYTIEVVSNKLNKEEEAIIEQYFMEPIAKKSTVVEEPENINEIAGIVVSIDKYSKYKFLLGKKAYIVGVATETVSGEIGKWSNKETLPEGFVSIEDYEKEVLGKDLSKDDKEEPNTLLHKISKIKNSAHVSDLEIEGELNDGTSKLESYDLHTIVYNGNLLLDGEKEVEGATLGIQDNKFVYEFGDKTQDVSTAQDDYAKYTVVLKVNGDLTIGENVILTACKDDNGYGGPKGMIIFCTGTITNNGTISMTARGANAIGQNVFLFKNLDGSYEYVPAVGGNGGNAVTVTTSSYSRKQSNYYIKNGNEGEDGNNRQTGGGGAGGSRTNSGKATSGNGGNGTSYSGGSGGGGTATYSQTLTGNDGSSTGGNGGDGNYRRNGSQGEYAAGGGSGNKAGTGYASGKVSSALEGTNGTGGLLVIFSNKIINNNVISSNGTTPKGWLATGGSSGGGSINIFYTSEYQNNGTVEANGGASSDSGGKGGNGSITISNIPSMR